MLIHKTTDYAIRLLCCLAGAKNPVPSSKLAVELGVSPRYVLHFGAVLREAGFVQVTGGPAGGFSLARSPENISLWEDRKSTRLNSSHKRSSRMPSSA